MVKNRQTLNAGLARLFESSKPTSNIRPFFTIIFMDEQRPHLPHVKMTIYSITTYVSSKRAVGTRKNTEFGIRNYLNVLYPGQTKETADECSIQYIQQLKNGLRNAFDDIMFFLNDQFVSEKSPLCQHQYISQITDWLRWNDVILTPSEMARIKQRLPRRVVLTEDEVLTTQKIQTIVTHSDVLMRAFLLTLSSSGMRANELVNIHFTDMRDETKNGGCRYFHIPAARMKARKQHDYRYSKEAADAIDEWMKVRDQYIKSAEKKAIFCLGRAPIVRSGDYLFPFTYANFRAKLINALTSARMIRRDENSGRHTITFQSFRRWFDSTLKTHMPLNMANEIVGHDEGLSSNYRRYPREEVDKAYLAAEPYLRICAPDDYKDLLGNTAEALSEQKSTTAALAAEILRQRDEIKAMRLYIESTKKER